LADQLKQGLKAETKAWKTYYSNQCNATYRVRMNDTLTFVSDMTKRLNRPIKDLEDVRSMMAALKELRQKEITIDMGIGPIEVRN
jgi:dynein heavy chain